jgi:hypothetical protein
MDDMLPPRKGIGWLPALAIALAIPACGGEPAPMLEPAAFRPIPLAACPNDPADGLAPDQRSLVAMIAALDSRMFAIHQVSQAELTIYTRYREIQGIPVAWEIRFQGDGAGELMVAQTMPQADARTFGRIRAWGRKLAATFDRLKCLPSPELRARCERAGFTF